MSLTIEWRNRINSWRKELPNHLYRPLGGVEMSGFITTDQLTAHEAQQRALSPMPVGTAWGAKWEYAWFRGEIVLPAHAAGQRIVFRGDVGGEGAVYINGVAAGAIDREHTEITLAASGQAGARYVVLIEAYAGHGPRNCTVGPTPPDRETVPEPGPAQATVGASTYGVWQEDVYQLMMDVETLFLLRERLDANSLRVAEIDAALRDFTTIVDFELPRDEMLATVRAGRERLAPLLACTNGSTAPKLFMIGHSHIDVAWLWPLIETERKCVRTFGTQMALMQQYPEYRFLQSQAHLYWMVKNHYPDLYARIRDAVRSGQWVIEGGMWVEADTNISGGESLIRQFMHGKRFFQDEFGVECHMLWLPDVFGYSGNMPQIMRGCGIEYFATAKIFWNYNGGETFPHNTFTWEGIDGSTVLVHLMNDYNSRTDPATAIERWSQRVQKDGIATRLVPFGWGDGGGGPTRDHLEYLRRLKNLEGAPKCEIATPIDYFRDQEARGVPDVRYVGELYFQAHRGTYTSQARTKRGNRKSELALRDAEMWGVAAQMLRGYAYPMERMDEAWKRVLLNQFHDIIPGSSIHRVYEEAEASYAQAIKSAQATLHEATTALVQGVAREQSLEVGAQGGAKQQLVASDQGGALAVFNSLNWERVALAPLPAGYAGAVDGQGRALPTQAMGGALWVEALVPPCGWTTVRPGPAAAPTGDVVYATERSLENGLLRVTFDDRGEIASIYDKESKRELAAGPCNSFKMYKDVTTQFDAWDIDSMYAQMPIALPEPVQIEVLAAGPLVAKLRLTRKLHASSLTQVISLRRGSRRVDFETEVDWQESHKLLKVAFPVNIHAHEAIHEIQFGHIRRPNHYSRPFDADRFEVANHKWSALAEENRGFAVLNDCKYGLNVLGNSINLTLLKSAMAPDMTADKGKQVFTYAFYAWNGSLAESDVVRQGYELNCPVVTALGAAGEQSLFSVDAPNVVIEAVKPAEDGSGDVIVRLYESKRMATRCQLATTLPVARAKRTDMLEKALEDVPFANGRVAFDLSPFEVKTIRFSRR